MGAGGPHSHSISQLKHVADGKADVLSTVS